MPVLYFLPWVSIAKTESVGDLKLVPYERGIQPTDLDDITLTSIDAVLANYGNQGYSSKRAAPITHATIITWNGASAASESTDEEIQIRLQVGQQLAFCALARRQFCSHIGYCNTDGYRMIAQCYTVHNSGAIAVRTRRRDGYSLQYLGNNTNNPRFVRPLHVDGRLPLDIDFKLLEALQAVIDPELKERISAAIDVFVRANTDAPDVPESTEIVLLRIAFETLLGSTHQTDDLVRCFADHFGSDLPSPPIWHAGQFDETAWRKRWPNKGKRNITRPLDAWINDFCDARNAAAHGSRSFHDAPIWQIHNHLMFASWIFPLMVKGLLVAVGLYHFTDDEVALRRGFEEFFAHDVAACFDKNNPELMWTRVERSLLFQVFIKTVFSS